jgi:hypothetical protein
MERSTSRLLTLAMGALLALSCLLASPVFAQGEVLVPTPAPAWVNVTAVAGGNYPGGNQEFNVLVVNSDLPPEGNMTVENMTLATTAWSGGTNSNFGIGLPTVLAPGDTLSEPIALPIPSDFSAHNFTADLVVNYIVWNGAANVPGQLTGQATVVMLNYPGQSSGQGGTTTVTATATGGVSTTTLGAGVAVPSIIALVLLILLVRGKPKPAT